MTGKKPAESLTIMTELVLPNDTNMLGHLLGGRLMHFIDLTGAMAAYRHARAGGQLRRDDHSDGSRSRAGIVLLPGPGRSPPSGDERTQPGQ